MSAVEWKPGTGPRGPVPGAGGRLLRRLVGRAGGSPATDTPHVRAVLWDMDGLLLDSEPLWTVAETELAARHGAAWTEQIKAACIGKRLDEAVPIMLTAFGTVANAATVDEASQFLLARMAELFAEHLPVLPGAAELLDACRAGGVPCALVSSSFRILVDACLAALERSTGVTSFATSIAGDEVSQPKPDPRPYLLAAAALGVDPADCVVLEDSVTGARSGVAAGCTTVLVPGATVPPPAVDEGWVRVGSLTDLSLPRLAELLVSP